MSPLPAVKCSDCTEHIRESERPALVHCGCGAVLHSECAMSDPATARSYCEPCFYSPARQALAIEATQAQGDA